MILSKPSHEKHQAFSPYAASNCSNYAPPSISGLILQPLHIWATSRAISRLIARVGLPALGPCWTFCHGPFGRGFSKVEPPSNTQIFPLLYKHRHLPFHRFIVSNTINNTTSNSPFVSYPHYPTSTVNLISRLRPLPRCSPFSA